MELGTIKAVFLAGLFLAVTGATYLTLAAWDINRRRKVALARLADAIQKADRRAGGR